MCWKQKTHRLFFGALSFRFPTNARLSGQWTRQNKQMANKWSEKGLCLLERQNAFDVVYGLSKK